jgi:glycosyltransferase 2 family protein
MRPALKYSAIAVVTAALFYLAFRGQNVGESLAAAERARIWPLLAGLLLMYLSHAVRAYRWQIVLRPVKARTSFWRALKATIAGYGMNNLIPRSGEIVRPYLMSRGEKMPFAGVLASVVIERLADVIALAILIAFSFLMFQSRLTAAFPMLSGSTVPILAAMVLVLILFVLMFFSERRTAQFIRIFVRRLPERFAGKIETIALDFSRGLQGLDRRAALPLILGTVGIWLLYGISMYVSLQSFSDMAMSNISLSGAFLLLTLSGIAFTIPTPGASGTYHFFISQGLARIFGVPPDIALAYAIVTHAMTYASITLFGIVILFREGISFGSARDIKPEDATIPNTSMMVESHG